MKKSTTTRQTSQLYWSHAKRYPVYLIGGLISAPLSTLVAQFLPAIVMAHVLNRLAKGQFTPHDVWGSFGGSLVLASSFVSTQEERERK